jgi:hypothetical protein
MIFDGTVLVNKHTIKFYRRTIENEEKGITLEEFLKSIKRENMAWDAPTNTLYYKDTGGKLYKVKFEQIEEPPNE